MPLIPAVVAAIDLASVMIEDLAFLSLFIHLQIHFIERIVFIFFLFDEK